MEHGLIFERFIDINRMDLPDIDIDFPDDKRQLAIKYLINKYGKDNVSHISNVNRLMAKSAINEFGMSLSIPKFEVEAVKDALVDRSGGDARADMALADTLEQTEIGQNFIEKYPKMMLAKKAEGHALHAGKHAAGVIVCNEEITNFCGVNSRDFTLMMDKKEAEGKNLLKIDCLGLRTLSILSEAAYLAGLSKHFYYNLPIDDQKVFDVIQNKRYNGIFQFEGDAMQGLCDKMTFSRFEDIVSITALARPGPLHSGAAHTYVKRRSNLEHVDYICLHPEYIKETEPTMGVIVYQEQLMNICRNMANMSWEDVSEIRKAASKTLGKEFFSKYKDIFLEGCKKNKVDEPEAEEVWSNMLSFGAWAMNKSHAVSYGYISYWCAYMKAYYPLEFTVASLNHSKDEESAIRILRDAHKNDGLEYVPVCRELSDVDWAVKGGKMIGGLTNIKGIAAKKAHLIISRRESGEKQTPAIEKMLGDPKTPYDILYPTKHYWNKFFDHPQECGLSHPPTEIKDIDFDKDNAEYIIVARVVEKKLKDFNDHNEVVKRGGKILENDFLSLRLVLEDDTNKVFTTINRKRYHKMHGDHFNETLKEGESWVIVKASVIPNYRMLSLDYIFDLKNFEV